MTADTEAATLAIARRILADPTASADRVRWADDVVLWIEFGDLAAGKRCGHSPPARAALRKPDANQESETSYAW